MDHSLPGADSEDVDLDYIVEASDRNAAGDPGGARKILMAFSKTAHSSGAGNFSNIVLDISPCYAINHR